MVFVNAETFFSSVSMACPDALEKLVKSRENILGHSGYSAKKILGVTKPILP